ncbi:MAG: ABC transporter ATP-binding protein/permease [Aestuariivirgaceae bacterium]|nr:ABC transporter ATP-binding protein/permease [Aestuariivirgaceae bacterium]
MIDAIFGWFEKRVSSFPPAQPEQPPARFWPFVRHYAWPFRKLIAWTVALGVVTALAEVSLFGFLGNIVDWLSTANRETFWADHGLELALIGGLVLIVLPILKFIDEALIHQGLLGNFAMRIRWQAHRYVLRQSLDFFQNDFAGRVATKVMQTSLGVRDVVIKLSEILTYVSVYFLGALGLFIATDWRLGAPLAFWLITYVLILRYFVPQMAKLSSAQSDARSLVTGRIVDSYTNIPTVKLFAHAAREEAYAREGFEQMLGTVYASMRMVTLMTACMNIINALLLFSTAALSIWLWHQGAVTTGAIALTTGFVLRMQGMAHWILWEVSGLFENIGIVQDGITTIAREREVMDASDATPLKVTQGEIRFDHARFNYGKKTRERDVLDAISLTIKPGEKVGLVGRSGAGKSTLVNLLLRFHDLQSGRILIDGQDIALIQQESLRAQIGMVTQDTSLLHRSVMENIRYGNPDASFEDVVAAAKKAHAHEFITGLEDLEKVRGYEAQVGERGVKLSGGQRQRIAIARVLLKNAPILILDEATSALDSEVEQAIQENLYTLMEGKTVIAVAHRLSTIAAMDRLIVLDKGRVVEEGTHEGLLKGSGLYASLWQRQSGGFIANEAVAAE